MLFGCCLVCLRVSCARSVLSRHVSLTTTWGPPVISWFRFTPVTTSLFAFHKPEWNWSDVHLSYRTGASHCSIFHLYNFIAHHPLEILLTKFNQFTHLVWITMKKPPWNHVRWLSAVRNRNRCMQWSRTGRQRSLAFGGAEMKPFSAVYDGMMMAIVVYSDGYIMVVNRL